MEQPDGIIITISAGMYGVNGYRHWLRNFLNAMREENCIYSFRTGNPPRREVLYIYLCIGGKVRFRVNFVMARQAGELTFDDGRTMYGKGWVSGCGPVERAPFFIPMKGFQGFRYTQKLF